jgi:hypothetical protein
MRKIFAVFALMFMCIGSPAYADKASDDAYAEKIVILGKYDIALIDEADTYRHAACLGIVDPKVKEICLFMWSDIMNRLFVLRSENELRLKAVRLDPKDIKERTLVMDNLLSPAKSDAMREEVKRMMGLAKIIYPAPKK